MKKIEMMKREEFNEVYCANIEEEVKFVYVGMFEDEEDCEVVTTFGYAFSNGKYCLYDGLQYTLCNYQKMIDSLFELTEALEKYFKN